MSSGDGAATDETIVGSMTDDGLPVARGETRTLGRGDVIGRYVVLELVGAGGMGMVYAAYDPELDRKIALKLVRAGRRGDPALARTRLMREAQAMARLTHPNVITVHDVGDFDGQVFVAMEFIEGQTLAHWREHLQPGWKTISETFGRAASGLAAAHAAGLVHRDFKPDNVMIADDGRVVVMDFGLARAGSPDAETVSRPIVPAQAGRAGSSGELSTTVTREGALVGTPAYMAPEQHLGLPTDARTDQFSFGIAFYECLYAQHPFEGTTLAALANAVADGEIRAAPRGSDVPPWVRRVVLRTLEVKAQDRYPSMEAVIADLGRDPAAARKRALTFVGVVGLSAAAAAIAYTSRPHVEPSTCGGAQARAAEVWRPEVAHALRAGFAATGVGFADETSTRMEGAFEVHLAKWTHQYTAACEAGIAGEHTDHVRDLQMACLQRNLDDVRALLDALGDADASVVAKAADAAEELADPDTCADVDALLASEYQPPDPALAEIVAGLQARVPKVRALYRAGRPKEAYALAVPLAADAEATHYGPVIAEALSLLGHLQIDLGQYPEAAATLEQAVLAAISSRSSVAADAGVRLAWVTGMPLHRTEEGLRWGRIVRAEFDRSGSADPWVEVRLLKNLGEIYQRAGDQDNALIHARQAVEVARRDFDADHPALVGTLQALGSILIEQGKIAQGQEVLREALNLREAAVGTEHPSLGILLNNLGAAAEKRGELDEAIASFRRAHDIKVGTYGVDHPTVGFSENNLSAILVRLGRHSEAIDHATRALQIWEKSFGPDHVTAAYARANLGRAELEMGDFQAAQASLSRALELAIAGEVSRDVLGEIRFALARSVAADEPKRARALAIAARNDYESLGNDAPAELTDVKQWLTHHGG